MREIATSLLAGESCSSVARSLNERGITTSTGSRWLPTTVRRLMTRPRNAGLIVHDNETMESRLPDPIITEAEHNSLMALFSDPARRTQTTNKVRNLLAGLIEGFGNRNKSRGHAKNRRFPDVPTNQARCQLTSEGRCVIGNPLNR
ncbi:MAG: recombinase family protein [Actinomycetota bacterium]|nr:recombinase family protein [Actinomycetota bacterium]